MSPSWSEGSGALAGEGSNGPEDGGIGRSPESESTSFRVQSTWLGPSSHVNGDGDGDGDGDGGGDSGGDGDGDVSFGFDVSDKL